jgi:hypothetical protein
VTWSDFFWDFLSNTLATMVGVGVGLPVGFWFERRLERGREKKTEARRQQELRGFLLMLEASLVANLASIQSCEIDIGTKRLRFDAGLELFTWDAIKSQVAELLDDHFFRVRVTQYFARLKMFESLVAAYRDVPGREDLRETIVGIAPQLRDEGLAIHVALQKFKPAPPGTP